MASSDFRTALDARNRADLGDIRFRILIAIPFVLLGYLFANGLGLLLWAAAWQFGLRIAFGTAFLAFNVLLVIFIVVDVKRRPQESWYQPRYRQADGSVKGHEFGDGSGDPLVTYHLERWKGPLFAGMPLMTSMSDSGNIAARGRAVSSGFTNLILGGPRSIAGAMAERKRISLRSQRQVVVSGESFVAWLSTHGPLPEAEVNAHLEAHPDQAPGFVVAREIDLVARFRNPEEFHYRVRQLASPEDAAKMGRS